MKHYFSSCIKNKNFPLFSKPSSPLSIALFPLIVLIMRKCKTSLRNVNYRPGMVTQAYNPSTLRGQDRRITWPQEFKTRRRPLLYKKRKKKKKSGMVVHTCGSIYSGGWGGRSIWTQEVARLQWAMIMPLNSNLDNRARLCIKKKKKKE